MSTDDPEDELSVPEKAIRTVTPGVKGKRDPDMDVIGWGLLLGMLVLLVPLLPFIIIVWLFTKLLDLFSRIRGE
ncbi:DUF7535 family protein [Natranaeroarchaeum sulfidigenes]|uniref:Uncharacterized protein n=1 Tax=Natranaeroarchaeum sulfidigenes TaxID=2784880 RepID=A0A897MUX7_9EURY|nr:hypothetical protein [Natranaeroarchaeum sulfidigenes]QSG04287.1 Uncharacterized protein AArcS_3100 [Natranaeroarchaeum sulfidigenes]